MKKLFFLTLMISFVLVSCEKDDPKTNSDSVLTKANVNGQVYLYDEFGNSITKERMIVHMENTSNIFWAETQKDGSFLVPNVTYFNNYKISYEKDGFGTHKKFRFNHEYTGSAGNIDPVNLSKKSTTYCSSLIVTQTNDTTHFHLSLSGSSNAGKKNIRLVFHSIPEISNEVFSHFTSKFIVNNSQLVLSLSKDYLINDVGLISGKNYYVQAYGDSYYSNSYFDEDLQKIVLPNLGFNDNVAVPTSLFTML